MISMSNQFNELEIDMHTNMEMVDVSRLPKELSYILTTLYKYNNPYPISVKVCYPVSYLIISQESCIQPKYKYCILYPTLIKI